MSPVQLAAVRDALQSVNDPEIRRPITELGMVEDVRADDAGQVEVVVLLTVAGCPMKETLTRDVTAAVTPLDGVTGVTVTLGVMSEEQRRGLREQLRGGQGEPVIPFAQPGSLTRVYAVASGQGGRRQVHRHRQPGRGDGCRGAAGRCRRRRRLRLLGAADARRRSTGRPRSTT